MADQPTRQLSEYIHAVSFPRLAAETVRETKRHIIDSVGCAIGGFSAPPSIIARRMAEQTQGHLKAGVLGEQWKTSPELAAFANGVMTRYLDFNDTYPGGHPSDAGDLVAVACPTRVPVLEEIVEDVKFICEETAATAGLVGLALDIGT